MLSGVDFLENNHWAYNPPQIAPPHLYPQPQQVTSQTFAFSQPPHVPLPNPFAFDYQSGAQPGAPASHEYHPHQAFSFPHGEDLSAMGEFLVDDQWDSILNDPHVLDEHESGSLAGDSSTDSPLARLGKSLLPNGPQRNSDPPSNLNVSIQTSANVAAGNPLGATPAGVPGTEGPVVPLNHLSVDVSVGGSDHVGQCTTSTLTDAVVVDFSISSLLLTRAQWYNVEVKFSNSQGRPLFAGRSVTIDEAISFEDSRKRIVGKGETEKEPLVVSVVGVCSSTGKAISKCNKCKEQDTVTTKRKRRRDSYESWTEVDKSNNSKLCQILETGCHAVEEDGTLRLRFRVMCCVGASRQYHKNHLSHSMEEIHSGCQGLGVTLQVSSREKNFSTVSKSLAQPIRIVGKAKTNNDKPPPADAENGSARLFTRQRLQTINLDPNPTKLPQQQLQTPTPVASTPIPGPATTVPPRSYKNPLSCAEKMKYICEFYEFVGQPIDDFISMHKLVKSYLDLIKPEFHLSYRAIFEPDFFMISNLMNIPIESPQMLHTFNTIAVIDKLKKRGKRQEQFFTKINKLRDQLLRTIDVNELPYDEALLFCDSIARSSVCNIFKGEFEIGRDVLDVAYKLYLSVKWTEIRKTSSFSFLMYLRASFIYDAPHLQDIYQWAENHTYQSIRTRIVSSNFISMCFPDFHKLDQHKQVPILGFPPKMQSELLHILQKLENTMYKEGFFSKSTSSTCASYATLSRCVLSALRNWILWDIPAAAVNIEECAVQVPLVNDISIDPVILNLATLVAVQLVGLRLHSRTPDAIRENDRELMQSINYAEILLKFSKQALMIWGKYLDFAWTSMFQSWTKNLKGRKQLNN